MDGIGWDAGVREAQGRNRQFATVNPAGKIPAIVRRPAVADDHAP